VDEHGWLRLRYLSIDLMCGSYHDVVFSATPQARQALAAKARLIANDFVTEVEVCCDLNHPHLVQFLGYAVQPQPMIVQELLRGSSVEHQLYTESWQPTPWQVSEEASSRALLNRQPRPAPAQLTTPPRLCSTDNTAPPRPFLAGARGGGRRGLRNGLPAHGLQRHHLRQRHSGGRDDSAGGGGGAAGPR
jgi:hypothetical protein